MRLAVVALCFAAAACGGKHSDDPVGGSDAPLARCATPIAGSNVTMRKIGRVPDAAVLATSPPNDPRLFVVSRQGTIHIFEPSGALRPVPFLDLSADANGPVTAGGELGLLGLAFHPQYATNGTYFAFYTTKNDGSPYRDVLVKCKVRDDDPDRSDPTSCVELFGIPDFAGNHNGGMLEFGKDGFLYISTGDGGGGGDPHANGQALVDGAPTVALLSKMLRIDVDHEANGKLYAIPAGNPFAAGGGAPEIFMLGLRNAWRWTFDRATGDMWIGDVGQDRFEELIALRPEQQAGANMGWSMYEGNECFRPPCDPTGKTFAQDVRSHSTGWVSIIGGQVYRGTCYPEIVGWYFYTDFGAHGLTKARLKPDDTLEIVDLPGSFPVDPASIHEDAAGELYETDASGNVYHLEVQ
jgi:glucose/arabinose dehydrogenase